MKLATLKTAVTRTASRAGLKVQKYSPEILVVGGVVAIVGGVVLACRATLKVEEIMDEHQSKMDDIEGALDCHVEGYTPEDAKKDKAIVYAQTVGSLAKVYAPAVGLLTVGMACMLGSYGILKRRNVALMAAYEGLQQTLLDYRERVRAKLGEEEEKRLYHGTMSDENDALDAETGEMRPTLPEGYHPSVYSRFFDETSTQWTKSPDLNKLNLLKWQDWANDLLHARGHLFLNEVYDMLGMPRSQAGAVVGWVLGQGGDEYVDFNMFDINRPKARDFVNGIERSILLDFNVDGVIWDKI